MSDEDRKRWDARYQSGAYGQRLHPSHLLQRWLWKLSLPDRPAVLDLACGAGRNSCWLSEVLAAIGPRVTGVDISTAGLELAADRALSTHLPITWIQADLEQGWRAAQLPDARFDLIVMMRYANLSLLEEAAGLLKPGGWLITELHSPSTRPVAGPTGDRFRVAPEAVVHTLRELTLRSVEHGWIRDPDGPLMSVVRAVARSGAHPVG